MDDSWLCNLLALTNSKVTTQTAESGNIFIEILIILVLILINAFFAATEMAVVSSKDSRIAKEAEEGDKKSKTLMKFIEDSGNFLATIQVGVTFAGFLSSAFAGKSFANRLAWFIRPSGPSEVVMNASLVVVTIIISYLSIVLGELVPKQIALANPEGFAKGVASIVNVINVLFKPFTWLINSTSAIVLRLLQIDPDDNKHVASEEEIRMLLDQGRKSGSIHMEESDMIVNVFEFNDKEVSEIMTHRTNIIAIEIDASFDEVTEIAVHEKYSRIPVYNEDIDDIVGVLHIKDLLFYLANNKNQEEFDLRTLLREPYWVPESKFVDELFREMQKEHVSMAVVIDEYGGTAGIVTIEDILEEIVGNIQDEYDEEDYDIKQVAEHVYEMSGLLSPEDISKVLPDAYFMDDDESDYDTVAGLVISLLGRIPDQDDVAEVEYRNMTIKVLAMDDKRIDRLQLTINQSLKEYEEELERLLENNHSEKVIDEEKVESSSKELDREEE